MWLRDAIGVAAANIGKLVVRLVAYMTVHAGAKATQGPGPDTFDQGSGSDTCDEAQFKEGIAKLRLKRVNAYVRIPREKKEVSEAAKEKQEYRAKRKAQGFGQYVVEVPEDEDAKDTVYAVAQAIVADKDNSKHVRSIILSVVSSEALLEFAQLLIVSGMDASPIIELIRRGDLARIAAIHAARPTLLDDVSRLAKTNDEFLSVLDCLLRYAANSGLVPVAARFGVTPAKARQCLTDGKALKRLLDMTQAANDKGVDHTPTFMIDGNVTDAATWEQLEPKLKTALSG